MSGVTQVVTDRSVSAPEETLRTPARRISAAGSADRATDAFKGALADLGDVLASMRGEITGLKQQVADLRALAVVEKESTSAALRAQADTITALTGELAAANAKIQTATQRIGGLEGRYEGHTHGAWSSDSCAAGYFPTKGPNK
ncbi:MAG: hypothetical protein NTX49_10175 [Chlamydiae bacterium]|nr:hypothetical protein [Chlamydiota bacterium]